MPTIMNLGNVRVVIYLNDHPPPHVHANRIDGARARLALNCPDGPVQLMEQTGFKRAEINDIIIAVGNVVGSACDKWSATRASV